MHIFVKYWQECNYRKCSFCNQRLGTKINEFGPYISPSKESLIKHTDLLMDFLNNNFTPWDLKRENVHTSKDVASPFINLLGGELFHRTDLPELYEGFEYLAKKVKEMNAFTQYPIIFSNLLFEDLSLVKHFIKNIDGVVDFNVSFDLDGRFKTKEQIDLVVNNVNELKKLIPIAFKSVITKATVKNLDVSSYIWKTWTKLVNEHEFRIEKFVTYDIDDALISKHFDLTLDDYEHPNFKILTEYFRKNNYIRDERKSYFQQSGAVFLKPRANEFYHIMNGKVTQVNNNIPEIPCYTCKKLYACKQHDSLFFNCKEYVSK